MKRLRKFGKFISKHRIKFGCLLIGLLLFYWFSLPRQLFNQPTSVVLTDRNGDLLGALIANDGQWRFPERQSVPEKFAKAIICFEDKRFKRHAGVDIWAMGRALYKNIRSGSIVSGGSTLTMQVIRLSRGNKNRNVLEKIVEMVLATRAEIRYSKNEILAMYASNAPFGGNVVGLDAAAWRYFGRAPEKLTWAESACLAVLPNSPSLVNPGKNRQTLLDKRDRLLERLFENGEFDETTLALSKAEPLPDKPFPLPQIAPHLIQRAAIETGISENAASTFIGSTIDRPLQEQVTSIIARHHERLSGNGVLNAAAVVLDVNTGEALAYVGNTRNPGNDEAGSNVDIITSPRSTGSILKPFLFASMLSDGILLPDQIIADIPVKYGSFTPKNYDYTYDGVVKARDALSRSLNVPIVRMLTDRGISKMHHILKATGMTTLTNPANHYGLSLILGGAETTLWDIAGMYASLARIMKNYNANSSTYSMADIHAPVYQKIAGKKDEVKADKRSTNQNLFSAGAIWFMLNAMLEVKRPEEEAAWKQFASSQKIAWKTGTSFGHRDAWAVGVTPDYVVACWAGNANGEGRPGLTGATASAPIMFDIFSLLRTHNWFDKPYDDLEELEICAESGFKASDICPNTVKSLLPLAGAKTKNCPYHKIIHLDKEGVHRVSSDCFAISEMQHIPWFILPPAMEWYYKSRNPNYKPLPPVHPLCRQGNENLRGMELIYPKQTSRIYIPVELDGSLGKTVFEVTHRNPAALVYWHIDEEYIGVTSTKHQVAVQPKPGKHILTLVDDSGERLVQPFSVIDNL